MDREPLIGEIVVVTHHSDSHDLHIGEKLAVSQIDESDETIQGWTRTSTTASTWIPWSDVEPVEFGWEYVKRHLPPHIAAILAACEGIEFISLNAAIKNQIQASAPDWHERVEAIVGQSDAPTPGSLDACADDEAHEDDDEDDDRPLFHRDAEDTSAPF